MSGSAAGVLTPELHAYLHERALRSARQIVPWIVRWFQPRSVLDVGCGLGAWLAIFRETGVRDVIGIDGPDLATSDPPLSFPGGRLLAWDLETPLDLGRRFDLVVCLEVGEHLPENTADVLVASLVRHGPMVLFSAAVPRQGGSGHRNERWPDWWADLFARRGYLAWDCLRPRFWTDPDVEWWYAQNAILYVEREAILRDRVSVQGLSGIADAGSRPDRRIHPRNLGTRWETADWPEDRRQIERVVEETTPPGAVVLVPEADRWALNVRNRRLVPYPARSEKYGGPPTDSKLAIAALHRQRRDGASYLAFPWPTFWWLDHYADLRSHLRNCHEVVREDDLVVLFRLAE